MMTKISFISVSILCVMLFLSGCKKDDKVLAADVDLYEMAKETTGFVWYKNSDVLLPKSDLSGHSEAYLRTRYNSIAATMLNASGKVQSGITFPEGSLIVKELYSSQTSLSKYAILYKKSDHAYADAKGWVWGYIKADGSVATSSSEKGRSCIPCHSQSGNIDYSLMNVAIP